jgi:hypothetical protein
MGMVACHGASIGSGGGLAGYGISEMMATSDIGAALEGIEEYDEDVLDRAEDLGIDPYSEPGLMWIVHDSVVRELLLSCAPPSRCVAVVVFAGLSLGNGCASDEVEERHGLAQERRHILPAGWTVEQGQGEAGVPVSIYSQESTGGESKRLVVALPWSQFTSKCQRF